MLIQNTKCKNLKPKNHLTNKKSLDYYLKIVRFGCLTKIYFSGIQKLEIISCLAKKKGEHF